MTHQCDISRMNVTWIQTSRRECRGPFVYMGHESSIFVRWIFHQSGMTQCIALVMMFAFLDHLNAWQKTHSLVCDMTHDIHRLYKWHYSVCCAGMQVAISHDVYVWHDSHICLWHDSCKCVTWLCVLCAMLVSMLACFNMQRHVMLQDTATHCTILQHSAQHFNTLHQYVALVKMFPLASMKGQTLCAKLHHTATHCKPLQQRVALVMILTLWNTRVNSLQCTTTHCETLQHTAKHCNTLQHTATHLIVLHSLQVSPWHITHQEWVVFVTMLALFNMRLHTRCNSQQHTATHCNTLHQQFVALVTMFALLNMQGYIEHPDSLVMFPPLTSAYERRM